MDTDPNVDHPTPSTAITTSNPPTTSADVHVSPSSSRSFLAGHLFHVVLHAVALVGGGVLGLWAGRCVDDQHELRHRRIIVPVLIEGADRQGGQFALGVSRAMEFAHRYRLDHVDDHPIEPWLLDERMDPASLVHLIKAAESPIIVGPLRSTPALELVPLLAEKIPDSSDASSQTPGAVAATNTSSPTGERGLGIPVILGIPTNTLITRRARLVWRLSPTDDAQGDFVAQAYVATVHRGSPAVIVEDFRPSKDGGNPAYVEGLTARIQRAINDMKLKGYPALEEVKVLAQGATADVQEYFERRKPRTIIYIGMPDLALDVLRLAEAVPVNATWIFTDSCITSPDELIPELRKLSGEFFITFQAPPAVVSKGLQQYMAYTVSTGGNVLFAADRDKKCDQLLAAPSYEIFGFDSYLAALLVLQLSKTGELPDVIRTINGRSISSPLLIGESYEFSPSGDRVLKDDKSNNTGFYLYEFLGACTRYRSLEELKTRRANPQ